MIISVPLGMKGPSMLGRVTCALLLLFSCASKAAGPVLLQPLGKWDVDYGKSRCTAARAFGSASDGIIFAIVPTLSGGSYELLVNRPKTGPAFAEELEGSVDFGHGPVKSLLLYYGAERSRSSTYRYRISASEMEQGRSAAKVTLHASGREDYAFVLTDMPALLDTLKNCTTDLQQYWNMGAKDVRGAQQKSHGNSGLKMIFSSGDYPTEALRNREQGKGQYQLLVDENGAVAGCDVLIPTGVAELDVMACDVMIKRAKFAPALDSNGKPVRSVYTTPPIAWRLP